MKDAYSFHTSQADLEDYYDKCHRAYERIFKRVGLPQVVSVVRLRDDGGNLSRIYASKPVGDSIVICKSCNYRVNMDAAENINNTKMKCPTR